MPRSAGRSPRSVPPWRRNSPNASAIAGQRFIVTSCLDEAKAERRQALDKLRERQIVLDEARRQERSETRKAELQEKAAEDARRESARAAHAAASSRIGARARTTARSAPIGKRGGGQRAARSPASVGHRSDAAAAGIGGASRAARGSQPCRLRGETGRSGRASARGPAALGRTCRAEASRGALAGSGRRLCRFGAARRPRGPSGDRPGGASAVGQ